MYYNFGLHCIISR